ncbi:MAG: type IV secretory system conjugative DNA transfer family protein, partial [Cumulibacter sp.]
WEKRIRVIARPGWGKTSRLLVPWARQVPGAALIGSVKADLFEQTVTAREARGGVRVVDFSEPSARFAAGYTQVHWNPIPGCEDLTVASRRARALVAGTDDGDREDNNDRFWRESARQVIEAWFHAAALAGLDIEHVLTWQANITSDEPKAILRQHPGAQQRALIALEKHLDPRSERTTSSVERFIVLALGPFGSADGRRFVGTRADSLDIAASIRHHETIYLLASEDTAGSASPLLTLFAEEWFYVARALAQTIPSKRLTPPAVAVLDELRWLVPLPSLPAIAARDRAAGIGLVYAVQAMQQEHALYGSESKALEQSVHVTILGGFDESAWQTITHQAGQAAVTSVSVSGGFLRTPSLTDSQQYREVITAADQQQLADGESVVRIAGEPLMYVSTASFREDRTLRKAIATEEGEVRSRTANAQEAENQQRLRQARAHAALYQERAAEPTDPPNTGGSVWEP